jgi:hypothetical protein
MDADEHGYFIIGVKLPSTVRGRKIGAKPNVIIPHGGRSHRPRGEERMIADEDFLDLSFSLGSVTTEFPGPEHRPHIRLHADIHPHYFLDFRNPTMPQSS